MSTLHLIPAFKDNYIWLIETSDQKAFVVDPGEADGVLAVLSQKNLCLAGILITHHHSDHTGGVSTLTAHFPVPVYGPREANVCTHFVDDSEVLVIEGLGELRIFNLPGHTLGHIAFYSETYKWLFCGDTLFSAGCGRVFEGTPEQMHQSLQSLAALPSDTLVCCAHEYTQSNIAFALVIEPNNLALRERAENVTYLRAQGQATVPTSLASELSLNPFLRCNAPDVIQAASAKAGRQLHTSTEVFTQLREWKNTF